MNSLKLTNDHYFCNPLIVVDYSSIIIDSFIIPLNLLQKKTIFEIFLGFDCREQIFLDYVKYIFPHTLLIWLQIEQLENVTSLEKLFDQKQKNYQNYLQDYYSFIKRPHV
jgi:hypothetical protein